MNARFILDVSCQLPLMTFQARAAASTNLSYLGIQDAENRERCTQTDGQPAASDLYTRTGALLSCRAVMYGWEYQITEWIEADQRFD